MPSSSIRARARGWLVEAGLVLAIALTGCGQVLGLDEYRQSDNVEDPFVPFACANDQVLGEDEKCANVGTRPEMCLGGLAEHAEGGCTAALPRVDCESGLAALGAADCAPSDDQFCDTDGYPLEAPTTGPVVFVDANAAEGGTGARDSPLSSIAEGLAHLDSTTRQVWIRGTFEEDVVIELPNVTLRSCVGKAEIVGQASTLARGAPCHPYGYPPLVSRAGAVCVASNGVRLQGVGVSGVGDGVLVDAATDVTLESVEIHDTATYGIRILQRKSDDLQHRSASVKLDHVAINRVKGAGVFVVGSQLTVVDSSIQNVLSLNDWSDDPVRASSEETARVPAFMRVGWARGIAIEPGWWASDPLTATPSDFAPSTVDVARSVIAGAAEVGIFAAGATVTLDHVFLGALANGAPSGRGLVAERSLPSGVDTEVTMTNSVIERASDAAIDVRDARVTVKQTTIRDTRGRMGDGCSGHGIRVRTFPTGDARSVLDIEDSSVFQSRAASVFAAASTVKMTRVLLSGARPEGTEADCSIAMGDGIVFERYPDQEPTDATLNLVRVDNASRAGTTTNGATISASSTLFACNGHGIVDVTGGGQGASRGTICGCSSYARCRSENEALVPWSVVAPSAAWPNARGAFQECSAPFIQQAVPLTQVVMWNYRRPEIVPVATGADGCAWHAVPPSDEMFELIHWKPGYYDVGRPGPFLGDNFPFAVMAEVSFYARLGAPIGAPIMYVERAPAGAVLNVIPETSVLDVLGRPLADNRLAAGQTNLRSSAQFWSLEPGWQTLELSEIPGAFVCQPATHLGARTNPDARFMRTDWGPSFLVEFMDCRETP